MVAPSIEQTRPPAQLAGTDLLLADRLVPVVKRVRDVSLEDVWGFMAGVLAEAKLAGYPEADNKRMLDVARGAGRIWQEDYYKVTMCQPMERATQFIFRRFERPRILDVACGCGTQALYFALLGAEVHGIDLDEGQLGTFQHRIRYYERLMGRPLPITTAMTDVKQTDLTSLGEFDVIFTRGGMGRFMSAEEIFGTFKHVLPSGGLVILHNGNPDCLWLDLARISRDERDASNRSEYLAAASRHGFTPLLAGGTTGLPRQAWRFPRICKLVNPLLAPIMRLQMQLELAFAKQ